MEPEKSDNSPEPIKPVGLSSGGSGSSERIIQPLAPPQGTNIVTTPQNTAPSQNNEAQPAIFQPKQPTQPYQTFQPLNPAPINQPYSSNVVQQSDIEDLLKQKRKAKHLILAIIGFFITLLVIAGVVILLVVHPFSKLSNYTLSNGGQTYQLKFYKGSKPTKLDGVNAIQQNVAQGSIIVIIPPTSTPVGFGNCLNLSKYFSLAFSATIQGQTTDVCQLKGPVSSTDHTQIQLFITVVKSTNDPYSIELYDPPGHFLSSSSYPTIKQIFQSIEQE